MLPFKRMETISKYTPKIERMEKHIQENPNDYQTKISLAILYGKEYQFVKKQYRDRMHKKIAMYKKEQESNYEKHE